MGNFYGFDERSDWSTPTYNHFLSIDAQHANAVVSVQVRKRKRKGRAESEPSLSRRGQRPRLPSPSMMARQPMGPMGPGTDQRHVQEQSFLSEIMRIPPNLVAQLKQELGLDGKDLTAMSFDEKRRLVEAHRQRSARRTSPQIQGNAPSSSSNGALTPLSSSQLPGSPPSSNGAPPPPAAGPDMSAALFTPDYIQSVANSLDEFDPSFLRPDGDINFERDFGQWFNHPDDVGGSLDLK
ncbi:hypothetical protein IW261DRAFT_412421 [Armillaria novae-zelandiae]|uniref:Uncharacterized protein n=1 Tax=Armillaria novae-zelandiae TaxID=153914 RepID=A0AA39THP4_9AGAR|nr:hypothetical protein IW261DRAFT_412421 [Armillaria novae-zelandiae]